MSCDGPIESIISSLLSSTSATLHSHISSAMASWNKKTPTTTPSHPGQPNLSLLHGLWSNSFPTSATLLATMVLLEACLLRAAQDMAANRGKTSLDESSKDINASLKVLLSLMQGRVLSGGAGGGGRIDPLAIQSEDSQMCMRGVIWTPARISSAVASCTAMSSLLPVEHFSTTSCVSS